jgi:hypothetical protein
MAIEVVCDCGKRLKAPDWMAGRGTQCPACWTPVRIPKRRWLNFSRGAAKVDRRPRQPIAPAGDGQALDENASQWEQDVLSASADRVPAEISAARSGDSSWSPKPRAKSQPMPAGRGSTFVPTRRVTDGDSYQPNSIMLRSQPRWVKLLPTRGEQRWHQSLLLPFGKLPVFFRLGLLQAVLTTIALILWLSMERDSPVRVQLSLGLIACLGGVFLVLGHTFHYFNAILEMASRGKTNHEPGIGCTHLGALVSCGHWLSCLMTGPALLFAAAVGYWLYCGDLTVTDWSILAELCFAAVGWWLIALLLTNLDDTLRVASPIQVLRTVFDMPWECATLTLLAAAIFLGHGFAAAYAIGQLHVSPLTAFPLLWICWSSGFYLTAFMFRRLGLTYHRAQQRISSHERTRAVSPLAARHQGGIVEDGSGARFSGVPQPLARQPK